MFFRVTACRMENEETVNTSVSLPIDLAQTLKEIARTEGRSVSAQVRIFLADAVTRSTTAKHANKHRRRSEAAA